MGKRVTIKDIAEYCGLSKSTVAYIVSNSEYRKGSEQNRKLVEEAVKALNYRPNHAAKSLSSQRNFSIGVTMPIASSSFYDAMVLELQRLIKKKGYYSLFAFWGGDDPFRTSEEAVKAMFERNVDGILSWAITPQFVEEHIPTVVYGGANDWYDSVEPDFEALIASALDYLQELGHRKIGFIGIDSDPRCQSFLKLTDERGIAPDPRWLQITDQPFITPDVMEHLLKKCGHDRPTALFVQSDSVAMPVIKKAFEAGLRVPEDLSIISCDNTAMGEFFRPALTTFDINLPEIGSALLQQLLERMEHPDAALKSVKIRPRLIIRESCSPCQYC